MAVAGREISVVGGGVAGLAVARALALRGARVTVFEQAPAISEVGAGIQISPNGMRVLDALDLGAAVRRASVAGHRVVLRDGFRGGAVLGLDLSGVPGSYAFVHRALLIEVLERGARQAGVTIALGQRREPGGAGLVVAADGLHSAHRAVLNGAGEAKFTGQVAWRAVIPETGGAPVAEVFMGPGRHLVSYPMAGGWRNIVAVEERAAWAEEGWHHEDTPDAVRRAFADFGGPVPGWLAQIGTVHLWGLFRHPVAPRWHGEGIVLLGDAAHPTLPFLAQGANMALEDAWVLGAALDRYPESEALPAYQAARAARAARIVEAANRNARVYHLRPPVRGVAHLVLRLGGMIAPGAPLARFGWLYDFDVTTEFSGDGVSE